MTTLKMIAAAAALLAIAGCSVAPEPSSRAYFSPAYMPLTAAL